MTGDRAADAKRRDARRNETALVSAATAAFHREGLKVPLGVIADAAGVGIATLYRHFPSREHLLDELTHRSFEKILDNARQAQLADAPLDGLRSFIDSAITHRNDLVLPLHGGPPLALPCTVEVQKQVHQLVESLLQRGRDDGTISVDATAQEVIAFGAMLAQPHASDPDWDRLCRRLLTTYVAGLRRERTEGHRARDRSDGQTVRRRS